jgi:hypothetical protein
MVYFNGSSRRVSARFCADPDHNTRPVSFEIEADALSAEGKFLSAIETYQAAINATPRNVDNT